MNAGAKLGTYGLFLATVFGAGAAVGAAVGPIDVGGEPTSGVHDTDEHPAPSDRPAPDDG